MRNAFYFMTKTLSVIKAFEFFVFTFLIMKERKLNTFKRKLNSL